MKQIENEPTPELAVSELESLAGIGSINIFIKGADFPGGLLYNRGDAGLTGDGQPRVRANATKVLIVFLIDLAKH